MSSEAPQWYPSKVDWWLVPLLCLPPLSAVIVCITSAVAGETTALLIGIVTLLSVVALYLGLVVPIRYGVDDTHLIVRFGVCRQRVPLANITEVYPTHNPLSSPALSLDRLHVQYGQGFFKAVMISPADRDGFLDDLARRAGMKREGDRLTRV